MAASTQSIAIIGGGPSGLMAAEMLSAAGLSVTVYERMPSPGRKFQLAGIGGLNLTHGENLERFLTRYGMGADAVCRAVSAFPPAALRDWAAGLGQESFVGSSGRVFPKAFKATPLLRAWLARLEAQNVRFALRHHWTGWNEQGHLLFATPAGEVSVEADATLLALGGASWPRLGSDGGWVGELMGRGVDVAALKPANVGFSVAWSEYFLGRHEGEPLKGISITFDGQTVRGEALISRTGIEGGAVYAVGRGVRDAILNGGTVTIHIDLKPDLAVADIAARLGKMRKSESLSNGLRKAVGLPAVAIALMREAAGGPLPTERDALAVFIKMVPLTLTGVADIARAISTAGGIAFVALDDAFMLRKIPGVFVAGEMLDWEAPTGGYLLQACFATGVAAADGILMRLRGG